MSTGTKGRIKLSNFTTFLFSLLIFIKWCHLEVTHLFSSCYTKAKIAYHQLSRQQLLPPKEIKKCADNLMRVRFGISQKQPKCLERFLHWAKPLFCQQVGILSAFLTHSQNSRKGIERPVCLLSGKEEKLVPRHEQQDLVKSFFIVGERAYSRLGLARLRRFRLG